MAKTILTRAGLSYKTQRKVLIVFSVTFFVLGGVYLGRNDFKLSLVPLLAGVFLLYAGTKDTGNK